MDKIMVGDIVKVNFNNAEHSYSIYFEWFTFYKVKEEKYEPSLPPLKEHADVYDEDYIVKWIAPHLRYDKMLYAIEGIDTGRVFLVDRDVIAGYYHTENSTDCCYDVNERLLTQEVSRLNSEIDTLKWEVTSLKEKLKEKSKEKNNTNVEINPMPRLKNGMFGITRYKNITSNETKVAYKQGNINLNKNAINVRFYGNNEEFQKEYRDFIKQKQLQSAERELSKLMEEEEDSIKSAFYFKDQRDI